jgi:DNA-binding FadR family transcriptional regulator
MSVKVSSRQEFASSIFQDCADDLRTAAERTTAQGSAPDLRRIADFLDRIAAAVAAGDLDAANAAQAEMRAASQEIRNRKGRN